MKLLLIQTIDKHVKLFPLSFKIAVNRSGSVCQKNDRTERRTGS
jgi:hypothetical protein